MTFTKKRIYSRLFNRAFIVAILFLVSCESDDSNIAFSDLEVYVSGTLSSNPRSGLKVVVYETEEDAINEVNAITFSQTTDSDGFAFFQELESGFRYWVRVDTTLLNNINRTDYLSVGFNEMSMTIL